MGHEPVGQGRGRMGRVRARLVRPDGCARARGRCALQRLPDGAGNGVAAERRRPAASDRATTACFRSSAGIARRRSPGVVRGLGRRPGRAQLDRDEEQFLYGLISRGHITVASICSRRFGEYEEMEVINYETGWKATGQTTVPDTVHLYYEDFKDYQANFSEPTLGINNPTNRNAETSSHLWGVELSGQARFGGFGSISAWRTSTASSATFSDVDSIRSACRPTTSSTCRAPRSPSRRTSPATSAAYAIPLGDLYLTPRVDVAHTGETQAALWDSPIVTLEDPYARQRAADARAGVGALEGRAMDNECDDKHYISGIQNNATLYYAAPPRQYGLRAKFNF